MPSFLTLTTDSVALALEAKEPSESNTIFYCMLEDASSSSEVLRIKEHVITNLSNLQISLCKESVEWTHAEKRNFW
ncbi:hypothetical protein DsansV1_C46g0242481 [Dioscorea sansibarensis]